MAIDNIRLPINIEKGAIGGPRFKTSVMTALSGVEQRIAEWDDARCDYDIAFSIRTKTDLHAVLKLFRARQGPAYPFRFKDWSDYEGTTEAIGTGDGVTAAFQLVKTYTDTVVAVTRTIQLPVSGTLTVYVAAVAKTETTHYTVNYSTGVVTFTGGNIPSAAQAITATFEFDVPVRFAEDELKIAMERFDLGSIPSIMLTEVLSE